MSTQTTSGDVIIKCGKCGLNYFSVAGHNCPQWAVVDNPINITYPVRDETVQVEAGHTAQQVEALRRELAEAQSELRRAEKENCSMQNELRDGRSDENSAIRTIRFAMHTCHMERIKRWDTEIERDAAQQEAAGYRGALDASVALMEHEDACSACRGRYPCQTKIDLVRDWFKKRDDALTPRTTEETK